MNISNSFKELKKHGDVLISVITGDKNFIDINGNKSIRNIVYNTLKNASSQYKDGIGEIYTSKLGAAQELDHEQSRRAFHSININLEDNKTKRMNTRVTYNGPYLKTARIVSLDDTILDYTMSKYFNVDSENITKWDLVNYNITETKTGSFFWIYMPNTISEIKNYGVLNVPYYQTTDERRGIPFRLHKESFIDADGNTVDMYLKIREG